MADSITRRADVRIDATLAGSILTMVKVAQSMKAMTSCTVAQLVAMTSANAAK